ncbi:ABC transporter substrate-binding protein [Campylobacter sp. TTU-622]|uniref:ABC transporter substrate-binding protein n=1 Tax=unclassified Campylobacter TaxID=2593542 RepID=UPI001906BB30|nr:MULTISPECIES: ABC transporter substrate-binding protein [unclassified Campylobacter]MBK1973785.1 ABC transporter substrate-binding protein [Campylobacter sp. TTU-622]MBK1991349.1 ABC transporter substrate-binding protein [Campylobacter sp. 2018MI34]
MLKIFLIFLLSLNLFSKELKVIALDWTAAETMMLLGYHIQAVGDKKSYNTWVKEPSLQNDTLDLGLRVKPNLEQVIRLKPDILISSSLFSLNNHSLQKYTKVYNIDFYKEGDLYESINNAVLELGVILSKEKEAKTLIENTKNTLKEISLEIKSKNRPLAIVQFIDPKHLRIYTNHSIFGVVLKELGLENAYKKEVKNVWGVDNISFLDLLDLPENTRIIIIKPHPFNIKKEIKNNPFYQKTLLFKDYIELDPIWSAGSLLSIERFAKYLKDNLK